MSTKNWRIVLGKDQTGIRQQLQQDQMLGDMKRATKISEVHNMVQDILHRSSLADKLTLDQLRRSPAKWGDATFMPSDPPSDVETKEILWELAEINFRHDFLSLDRLETVHMDAPNRREWVEQQCWPDPSSYPELANLSQTIASRDPELRHDRLCSFWFVVREWRCDKPTILAADAFPSVEDGMELERIERSIAEVYVIRFYQYFHRPASIPCIV